DVDFLLGKSTSERQHAAGVVHAMGDDRRIWLYRAELFPHRRVGSRKFGVQYDTERNVRLLEDPADARDAPVDRVLAECLIHEVRVAGCQVRAEDGALAEAKLLDKQREA